MDASPVPVRQATVDDAHHVARLLHDFNVEFSDPVPGLEVLTERMRRLIADDDAIALIGGEEPVALAILRLRATYYYADGLEAYLQELYVAPPQRGRGIGRALLKAAMSLARERGAHSIDLNTSVDDEAARALYERSGFTNREGGPDGPRMLYYEREL